MAEVVKAPVWRTGYPSAILGLGTEIFTKISVPRTHVVRMWHSLCSGRL